MERDAAYWIDKLRLIAHPEGGAFRESYRAGDRITAGCLPQRYSDDDRACQTAIYFLLESGQFSAFHRLQSDEVWHFYFGSPLWLYLLSPEGQRQDVQLGQDLDCGQCLQTVIRHGTWFAAEVEQPASYTLVGCTMAPGFEFSDFELAEQSVLLDQFPQHAELIRRLTRDPG